MPDNTDLETRLRAYLQRTASPPPPPGLADRVRAHVERPHRPPTFTTTLGLVAAIALVVVLVLLLTPGQQSSHVFSNISNGIGQ